MSSRETPAALERAIDRLARTQPPRRAPAALSRAVLATIERRAARSWWRSDFRRWPAAARVLFLVTACVPVAFAYLAAGTLAGELNTVSQRVESLPQVSLVHALGTALRVLAQAFSSEWLYGSVIAVTLLYAAVFGLGAAGYRVLYARAE